MLSSPDTVSEMTTSPIISKSLQQEKRIKVENSAEKHEKWKPKLSFHVPRVVLTMAGKETCEKGKLSVFHIFIGKEQLGTRRYLGEYCFHNVLHCYITEASCGGIS